MGNAGYFPSNTRASFSAVVPSNSRMKSRNRVACAPLVGIPRMASNSSRARSSRSARATSKPDQKRELAPGGVIGWQIDTHPGLLRVLARPHPGERKVEDLARPQLGLVRLPDGQ